MTIGRYQRTNQPILIIGKTADNRPVPIIGRLSVHLYILLVRRQYHNVSWSQDHWCLLSASRSVFGLFMHMWNCAFMRVLSLGLYQKQSIPLCKAYS